MRRSYFVSILVFVELALGPSVEREIEQTMVVSILVFVELALGRKFQYLEAYCMDGFNPCFRGTRSRTIHVIGDIQRV